MKLYIAKSALFLTVVMLLYQEIKAQEPDMKSIQKYSGRLQSILKPSSSEYWLDFRQEIEINSSDFMNEFKSDLKLTTDDEFKFISVSKDQLENNHNRYQQYYRGIKIEGAEFVVHESKGRVKSVNGRWVSNMNHAATPLLNENQALQKALAAISSKDYLWDEKYAQTMQVKLIKEAGNTVYPKGEKVFCRKNWQGSFEPDNINLAWKFTLHVLPKNESAVVYIDAVKGTVIHKNPLILNCAPGEGATTWYGTRSFTTSWRGWPDNTHHLDYDEGGCGNRTQINSRRRDSFFTYNYGDANNQWFDSNGRNGYNQRAGVTTYWGLIQAYDYYFNTFGRRSYNNANGHLNAFSEIPISNASWDPSSHVLEFGGGADASTPLDDYNCIDIVGHEMTHGVVQFSANLNYSYESGALNESFADIFGETIQNFAIGSMDWLMAADKSSGAIRSYSNPNRFGQPDTYGGRFWYTGTGDYGGVHYNSGVQNFWFYLLANGGSGLNDNGKSYNVASVGVSTAAAIAYRNLDVYLTSSSTYIDAREGALRAAEDLYGSCSNQVIQTANAWHAVGVGDAYFNGNLLCGLQSPRTNVEYRGFDILNLARSCALTFQYATGGNISLVAGKQINLYPGFTVQQNTNLTASIDPCIVSYYPTAASSVSPANSRISAIEDDSTTGKEAILQLSQITLFPNPANDFIIVHSNSELSYTQCFISDIVGNKYPCYWQESGSKLDISKLKSGLYLLHLTQADRRRKTLKFIKQ